jgi:hypothetical protein
VSNPTLLSRTQTVIASAFPPASARRTPMILPRHGFPVALFEAAESLNWRRIRPLIAA